MKQLDEAIKIAQLHADRMKQAATRLEEYFPISTEKLENFSFDELAMLELYTSRFAKLQDQLGQKVFTLFLEFLGELQNGMSFIDKLNKLEKLQIIESADQWQNLRWVRNHISHEYPDDPKIMIHYLNDAYNIRFILLDCLDRIIKRIEPRNGSSRR